MPKKLKIKERYAIVGTGARAFMFSDALLNRYSKNHTLVALCDVNLQRMACHNATYKKNFGIKPLPSYPAKEFDQMIAREKPGTIIVTSIDRTHHFYIIRAMELGCNVITEKPLTIDADKCQAILDAVKHTGRKLRVTFNYRYAPIRSRVKELIRDGVIGEVKSVHFEWLLDTCHGADYFRRWHRDKRNSGGLMVHKSTHHFDLVNWWLDSSPQTVFGLGSLAFYGKTNAESRGAYHPYVRSTDAPAAHNDPFALNLRDGGHLENLYLMAEKEDAYQRDQNVFGDGISIEDTINLVVRYESGAQLSYSLTAYAPWEGCRVAFNGTKGRIELEDVEKSYVSSGKSHTHDGVSKSQRLTVHPHWSKPWQVDVPPGVGGHGGSDHLLLEDLFGDGTKSDPLERAAGHLDGARSILTGIAANQSFATGLPVTIKSLVQL